MNILETCNLSFSYKSDGESFYLKDLNLCIKKGEFVCVYGKSGSGKSTLFHLLGCLIQPTGGKLFLKDRDIANLTWDEIADIRNREIGFIFQQFHLLSKATVLQNILLPIQYLAETKEEKLKFEKEAIRLATEFGIEKRLNYLPNQLSGGEQQRVAIARALITGADLILADEPTGNLDSKNTEIILEVLKKLNQDGKTILMITHDSEIAKNAPTLYQMKDGKLHLSHSIVTEETSSPYRNRKETSTISLFETVHTAFPLALQNIKRNKLRAFLTMLGVSIGIAAVFAMLSFGRFAKEKVIKGYEELGANTAVIRGYPNWLQKATDSTTKSFHSFDWEKDLLKLHKIFPSIKNMSPLLDDYGLSVSFAGVTLEKEVMAWGVNEKLIEISNRKIDSGKFFNIHHIDQASPVCLIGSEVKARVFKNIDPIGKILFASSDQKVSYPCKVIGVLAPYTSNQDWRKANMEIFMPFTYFKQVHSGWNSMIHMFVVQFQNDTEIEKNGMGVKTYFEQKYGAAGKFFVESNLVLISQMKKSITLFTLLLTCIALVTLSVGGIGINNMMLVSVTERYKEIGLRKALGAKDKHILVQFLLESILLCLIAGVIGVTVGFITYEGVIFGASKLVSRLSFEWTFPLFPFFFSLTSIFIVGVLSGLVPALKAKQLSIIEALRAE